ncbi:MAG: DUF4870 domain-containing protein [Ekhidna sp.]
MSILKEHREQLGYTQIELSKKAGLSLRTIQRLEGSNRQPKGYTLTALASAFNIGPTQLQEKFATLNKAESNDLLSIKKINLLALACFAIPFGNLILPTIVWTKKRQSKLVDEAGRRIINFQIVWSLSLSILLSVSPFLNFIFHSSLPIILIILFLGLAINLIVICRTAISLNRKNLDFLNLPIRFL